MVKLNEKTLKKVRELWEEINPEMTGAEIEFLFEVQEAAVVHTLSAIAQRLEGADLQTPIGDLVRK